MKLNLNGLAEFADFEGYAQSSVVQNKNLHDKSGLGNDFLGWIELPIEAKKQITSIQSVTDNFKQNLDAIVVIGIGGSYLGAKAILDAMQSKIPGMQDNPELLFAGHHLDQAYHLQLLKYLERKNWGIVVISKSGTTTEPAIAFRFLRTALIKQFGKTESKGRIIAITDARKGALRILTNEEGYASFTIPDDVGGRFSVLTPVGLVPLAIAGIDISKFVDGAFAQMTASSQSIRFEENLPAQYAAARYALYQKDKNIEILSNFNPNLTFMAEWWKQLYGESEGKDGKGLFPASVNLTTDLHSMGQFIQEGTRNIFETCILVNPGKENLLIQEQDSDLDQLNYLNGLGLDHINLQAAEGTLLAHLDGGVPVIRIEIEKINEYTLGELVYFFEKACGISGYLLGVNPFDQPGVEAYKKNMFALLGKPGFENETRMIQARLS
jgi:glucose-6-phosphate isomerase